MQKKLNTNSSNIALNVPKKRLYTERIFLCVVLVLCAIFFGRVALWERDYYARMEGSTRAVAIQHSSEPAQQANDVDETPVTEEQVVEYTVPADHPRYLSIPKLGIKNARVLNMGLKDNGELSTPYGIFDVGWYNASGTPGSGRTLLIDGHNGGPNVVGVFKYINTLDVGDLIEIERGDGAKFQYAVVENNEIPLDESDEYMNTAMTSAQPGKEGLTLITCIGEWSQVRQTYLSRQFVRAVIK